MVKCSKQSTPCPQFVRAGGGGYQTGSLLITNFLCFSYDADELDMEEAWKKQAETIVGGLDKLGTLKSIIDLACQQSAKIPKKKEYNINTKKWFKHYHSRMVERLP